MLTAIDAVGCSVFVAVFPVLVTVVVSIVSLLLLSSFPMFVAVNLPVVVAIAVAFASPLVST